MRFTQLVPPLLAVVLGCISGCANRANRDYVEAADPLAASALVQTKWHPGTGFVIDLKERLLVTTRHVVAQETDIEVVFPIIDDGQALVNKTDWLARARPKRITRGKVLISDPERDLVVLQLAAIPDGVRDLLLAGDSPKKDTPVQFIGGTGNSTHLWMPASSTVQDAGAREVALDGNRKATNHMIELEVMSDITKGVAGGAVINSGGEVVGVIASAPSQGGAALCTDISELRIVIGAAYRQLAMSAYQNKQYDVALGYSERALAVSPDDALGYNERGAAYSQKDQFDRAILDYSQALKLEPKLALAWRNRGSSYFHLGKYKECIADCTKAIELSPEYLSAFRKRSEAYARLSMTKEAEADKRVIASIENKAQQQQWRTGMVTGPKPPPPGNGGNDLLTGEDKPLTFRREGAYYRGSNGKRYIVVGGPAPIP